MSSTAAAIKRKGPGRPPKNQPPPPLKKAGIVESPTDAENRLEFVYDDPSLFKSLFTYFKSLRALEIHILCTPAELIFFTRDTGKTSRVVARFPGNKMIHYYCDGTFWLGLNRHNVEKIFSSIDKSFFKITILYRHDDDSHLTIIYKDSGLDKECNYKVTLSKFDKDEELYRAELLTTPEALKDYPVEFTLTSKQFKKTISDALAHTTAITIEQMEDHPLQFVYNQMDITYNEVYRSSEKISLRHSIKGNRIFRCPIKIANVKSLATAMVTEKVRISCREDADTLFHCELDVLVMDTLVSLV